MKRLRNFDTVLLLDDWNAPFNHIKNGLERTTIGIQTGEEFATIEAEDDRFSVLDEARIQAYKTCNPSKRLNRIGNNTTPETNATVQTHAVEFVQSIE